MKVSIVREYRKKPTELELGNSMGVLCESCTFFSIHECVHMCACVYAWICVCMPVCMCVCLRVCMHVHVCLCVYASESQRSMLGGFLNHFTPLFFEAGSVLVIKYHDQKQLGEERVDFSSHFHITVCRPKRSGQDQKAPKTTCPGRVLPTIGWALPHQSLRRGLPTAWSN